jgi:hypothetical protein
MIQTSPARNTPVVRVRSEGPWDLQVILLNPPRRARDGVEHPLLERLQNDYPRIPPELFTFQPFVVESGEGSSEEEVLPLPVQMVESVLTQLMRLEDPPGVYSLSLRISLLSRSGEFLDDPIDAVVEYRIEPWVEVQVSDPSLILTARSFDRIHLTWPTSPLSFVIRGNTSWELQVRGSKDLESSDGKGLRLDQLSISVQGGGSGEWEPLIGEETPLGFDYVPVATGPAPASFDLVYAVIPLRFSLAPEGPLTVGRYDTVVEAWVSSTGGL